MSSFTFIDLFCGIGGFHQALSEFGGSCSVACDIDKKAQQVYRDNYSLKELLSHTSADSQSGAVGDIEIIDEKNNLFESIEIKHGIIITNEILDTAFKKIKTHTIERYLILSTNENNEDLSENINSIKAKHGCHVIVNGVLSTIKYTLRSIENTNQFINNYASVLEEDSVVKYEHKNKWNQLF